MKKVVYENGNLAKSHIRSFSVLPSSHIKSIREDFNDMFAAEHEARKQRGDMSLVFVLTYNDEHILQKYGRNLLNANDLKRFAKTSAFAKFLLRAYGFTFDIVTIGEYGNGGISHNFRGVRGVGNNPHFHNVGYFHKEQESDPVKIHQGLKKRGLLEIEKKPLYEQLVALVRWTWQGCLESNKIIYGCSPALRALGLGYVDTAGEVITCGASAYISKYMGKNVDGLYRDLVEEKFRTSWLDFIKDRYIAYKRLYLHNVHKFASVEDFANLWFYHARTTGLNMSPLFHFLPLTCDEIESLPSLGLIFVCAGAFDELDEYFRKELQDFMTEVTTTYSPKLRKFRGFGYALIHRANMLDATYTITRPDRTVSRILPPSLLRHFFYNYKVCVNFRGDKVVKYELNKYGLRMVAHRLTTQLYNSRLLIKSCGSDALKQRAEEVTRLFHCVLTYDVHFPVVYQHIIKDDESAISFNLECHNQETPLYLEKCTRPLFDIKLDVLAQDKELYDLLDEFSRIRDQHLEYRDSKDGEFLKKCQQIYNISY